MKEKELEYRESSYQEQIADAEFRFYKQAEQCPAHKMASDIHFCGIGIEMIYVVVAILLIEELEKGKGND